MTDDGTLERYAMANLNRLTAWENAKAQVRASLPHERSTRRERRKAWIAKRRQMPQQTITVEWRKT